MALSLKSKQIKKKHKRKKVQTPDNHLKPVIEFKNSDGASNWMRMQEPWKIVLCGSFVLAILSWGAYDLEVGVAFSFSIIPSFFLYAIILGPIEKKIKAETDKMLEISSNNSEKKRSHNKNIEQFGHKQTVNFSFDIYKHSKQSTANNDLHCEDDDQNLATQMSVCNNSKMKRNRDFKFDFHADIRPTEQDYSTNERNTEELVENDKRLTKAVAMDCEMVGTGPHGDDSIIARVSIVNSFGDCLYDEFVKPKLKVTDFRTDVSGVRPSDLKNGKELIEVQKDVLDIIDGRILVGHSIKHDLDVLFISHPHHLIRDTAYYKPFRSLFGGRTPSLKKLAYKILGCEIQTGEHNSIEDAQAAMLLYLRHRREWESLIKSQRKRKPRVIVNSATD